MRYRLYIICFPARISILEKKDWIDTLSKAIVEAQKRKGNYITPILCIDLSLLIANPFPSFLIWYEWYVVYGCNITDYIINAPEAAGRSIPPFAEKALNYLEKNSTLLVTSYEIVSTLSYHSIYLYSRASMWLYLSYFPYLSCRFGCRGTLPFERKRCPNWTYEGSNR